MSRWPIDSPRRDPEDGGGIRVVASSIPRQALKSKLSSTSSPAEDRKIVSGIDGGNADREGKDQKL
ncbi:MAG: hypothetical protein HC938_05750 [Nitrospira sp.]|nr:hypothetical protein [Nitrospira sp.]